MHITRIELENIKSHAESRFDFARGTTAITGENGAGKTTLIEAVAWTLFDLLDYKKEDFVRRGAKKGIARVTFESGLDDREYTVYRDTGTGYYVYDPALKLRIADKKEEVCRFLWQHLGVEAGTDLDSLFRRAIGVPQGTFTAIFLETAAERKKAFDKLLKVEEYRRGADELLKTTRFIEQQVSAVRERIARAEGELLRYDSAKAEHAATAERESGLAADFDKASVEINEKTARVQKMDEQEKTLAEAKNVLENARAKSSQASLLLSHKLSDLEQSRQAAAKVNDVKADSEKHAAALGRIRELEREREAREKLRNELSNVEKAIAAVNTEFKHARERLDGALNAHKAIESLRPAAEEQEQMEKHFASLQSALADAKAVGNQIRSLDDKIERLRESYRGNQTQLTEAQAKTRDARNLEDLQRRDAEIVRELARLQANLERDERFQTEIKNGLCPILSQKCLNLKNGETLEDYITSQFSEVKTQITSLEAEYNQVTVSLQTSREADKATSVLATLLERETEISAEGKRLKEERDALERSIEGIAILQADLQKAETALRVLDNPKAKIQLLEHEVRREPELRENITKIESNLERLESERRLLVEQLENYKDLDAHWAECCGERDRTESAHRTFIANETLASALAEREKEWEAASAASAAAAKLLEDAERIRAEAEKGYDRDAHAVERAALNELQTRFAELRAMLESVRRRITELTAELDRLADTRKAMQGEFREKERLESVAEATDFIRTTLKEAAPLVARNYVYHVSLEANQTFREITGNAERTLKWGEDYGIFLEEGGYDRPFVSLSGGEQMAAALSVRLALLKQLTDIRIAFFDEPTTNMDAERRENLAAQISRIGHFDQLFVISHDDTFEGYVDNVVSVERTSAI